MTPEQKAAEVMARAARALIRAAGMVAENTYRDRRGETIAYGEEAFEALVIEEGIGSNQVIRALRD